MYQHWVNRWKEKGFISEEQANEIVAYEIEQSKRFLNVKKEKSWNPFMVLSIIACLFLVGSLLTFIASNWSEMSLIFKVSLLLMGSVIFSSICVYSRAKKLWLSRMFFCFSLATTLGSMVVLGQHYPIFSRSSIIPLVLLGSFLIYISGNKDEREEQYGILIWAFISFTYGAKLPALQADIVILVAILYLFIRKSIYNKLFIRIANLVLFLLASTIFLTGKGWFILIPFLIIVVLCIYQQRHQKDEQFLLVLASVYVLSFYILDKISINDKNTNLILLVIQVAFYLLSLTKVTGFYRFGSLLFLQTAYVLIALLSDGNYFVICIMSFVGVGTQISLLLRRDIDTFTKRIILSVFSNVLFTSVIVFYEIKQIYDIYHFWYYIAVGISFVILGYAYWSEREMISDWIRLTILSILSIPAFYHVISQNSFNVALIVAFLYAVGMVIYGLRKEDGTEKLAILSILYYFGLTYLLIFNSFRSKSLYFFIGSIILFGIAFIARKTLQKKGEI